MPKKQSGNKKGRQSNFAKLSIFQPNKYKFKKSCPLSIKGAPKVDYKNIKLLKKYVSENGKILPSRITNVSQKKQRELSLSIKRARNCINIEMKVILLENIKRIGSIGEVIEVKRGFARNFLISNKKALYASKENIKQVEKIKSELSKKDNEKKKDAKTIFEQINKKTYKVQKLSTENNELYGSVKPTEISKLIQQNDKIDIKPSMIQPINEIKSLGKFKVKISLHSEVDAEIDIEVESAESIQ
tara:strand:+ start:292 stop:1023 length:732 start_codon:yes stop_codon:yes gene_type:complete